MTVAVDATAASASVTSTATTSVTLTNLTVGAGATALLAVVNSNSSLTGLALTWDSGGTNQAMTLVGSASISTANAYVYIFGLLAPTAGAKTLLASWTPSTTCILYAMSFTGTATDTIANAFQNFNSAQPAAGTSLPITLTGATGNISFCSSANNSNSYTSPYLDTTSSTFLYTDATHVAGVGAYAPSASSVTWTAHTSSSLSAILAGVDVSTGGSPPPPRTVTTYIVGEGTGSWTPRSTVTATAELWGAGQAGDNGTGNGSAGAYYAKKNSISLTANTPVAFSLGLTSTNSAQPGGDTWLVSSTTVLAPGGASASTAIGDVTHAGGTGGTFNNGCGGSGGAGGPSGAGSNGGAGGTGDGSTTVGGGGGGGAGNGGGVGSPGQNSQPSDADGGAGGGADGGAGGTTTTPDGGAGSLGSGGGGGLGSLGGAFTGSGGAGGDDYDNGGGGAGGNATSTSGGNGANGGTPGGGGTNPGGLGSIIGRGGYSVIKITYTGTDEDQILIIGGITTIQIPSSWTADCSAEAWGPGGNGSNGTSTARTGGGGGSGGYSKVNDLTITAGGTLGSITVGTPGTATSIGTSLVANSGGNAANSTAGAAASTTGAVGDVKTAGAAGGAGVTSSGSSRGGASGAGAPGPDGAAGAGTATANNSTGRTGGTADGGNVAGGAGGASGAVGGAGTSDSRGGSGAGGGGSSSTGTGDGGAGGWPGGGGGGGGGGSVSNVGGSGAAGLIKLTRITPAGTAIFWDVIVPLETNGAPLLDWKASTERSNQLRADVVGANERLVALRADYLAPIERTISARYDTLASAERSGSIRFDLLAANEHTGAVRSDILAVTEHLVATRADSMAAAEHLISARQDLISPNERTGSIRVDALVPVEVTGSFLRLDINLPAERSGQIRSDVFVPVEFTGQALHYDVLATAERSGQLREDFILATEHLQTSRRDIQSPAEYLHSGHYDAIIPIEWQGTAEVAIFYDAAVPIEWLGSSVSNKITSAEYTGPLQLDYTVPIEALGEIWAFAAGKVGPITPYHFAPNANWPNNFDPRLLSLGFNLADVSSAGLLPFLPAGVKALVYVGNPNGVDATFTALMTACAPYINSIFAFYMADTADPDPSGTWGTFYDPANIKAQVDYIHTNFPGTKTFQWIANLGTSYAPNYTSYNGFAGYTPATTGVDWYGLDGYAVRTDLNNGYDTSIIGLNYNAALAAGIPADAIVPSYQAFGLGTWGAPYQIPTPTQLEGIQAAWALVTPNPPFDYYFAWGEQNGDTSLDSLPDLQVVAWANNVGQSNTPIEITGQSQSDSVAPAEILCSSHYDAIVPMEWQGTAQVAVFYDASTPIEWLSASVSNTSVSVQYTGQLRLDHTVPLEHLTASRSDVLAPIEHTKVSRSDMSVPTEILHSARYDAVVPMEWQGTSQVAVFYDAAVPIEWLASSAANTNTPVQYGGQFRLDHTVPLEHLTTSRSDALAPIQILITARWDAPVPIERLQSLHYDAVVPMEWLGTAQVPISYDVTTPLEWISQARLDSAVPDERNGLLRLDQKAPQEHGGSQRLDIALPLEHALTARMDTLVGLEWAGLTLQDTPVPVEYVGQAVPIAYNSTTPIEWGQSTNLLASSPIEFSAQIPADYLVPVQWTGGGQGFVLPHGPSPAGYVLPWLGGPGSFVSGVGDLAAGNYPLPWLGGPGEFVSGVVNTVVGSYPLPWI